jgi:hypothetical protein
MPLELGQRVRFDLFLQREKTGRYTREWLPKSCGDQEGIVVGLRHKQNGEIIPGTEGGGYYSEIDPEPTSWMSHGFIPVVLVATDIRKSHWVVPLENAVPVG